MTSEDAAVVAVLREQNWSRVGLAREVVRLRAELDRLRGGETVRRICNAVRVLNPAPMGHEAPHGPRVPGCNCREIRAALASGEESRGSGERGAGRGAGEVSAWWLLLAFLGRGRGRDGGRLP